MPFAITFVIRCLYSKSEDIELKNMASKTFLKKTYSYDILNPRKMLKFFDNDKNIANTICHF